MAPLNPNPNRQASSPSSSGNCGFSSSVRDKKRRLEEEEEEEEEKEAMEAVQLAESETKTNKKKKEETPVVLYHSDDDMTPLSETDKWNITTRVLNWKMYLVCNYKKVGKNRSARCPCCSSRDGNTNNSYLKNRLPDQVVFFQAEYIYNKNIRNKVGKRLLSYLASRTNRTATRVNACIDFWSKEWNTGEPGRNVIVDYHQSVVSTQPRMYRTPWKIENINDFKEFFDGKTQRYEALAMEFTSRVENGKTVSEVMKTPGYYIQHGLGGEKNDKDEPEISPVELYMESGCDGKYWKKSVIDHVKHLVPKGMVRQNEPCWITGMSAGFSRTHYDDYFNIAIVLHGEKTFYLAPPEAIDGKKGKSKHQNEAWDVSKKDDVFTEYRMRAGDILLIPPKWWHCVATEPNTVMQNFWYQVPDEDTDDEE